MRRIYASVLVLGVLGLFGFGMMRGIAQTDAPALKPEQLKPATYAFTKDPAAAAEPTVPPKPAAPMVPPPGVIEPVVPAPNVLPPLAAPKSDAPPVVLPPAEPKPEIKPAPEIVIPPPLIEPDLTPAKKDKPVELPKAEPIAAPKSEPSAPPLVPPVAVEPGKEILPTMPEVPFTNPTPGVDPIRPAGGRVAASVSIETIAPEAAAFGQPISYEIVVKNLSPIPVTHVRLDEELGTAKLVSSEPAGEGNGDKVMWMLGTLNAGEEKRIKVSVKPGIEGDLATKPRVTYSAATAMSVRITRPNLVVNVTAPEAVQVGDEVPVQIQVANNGSGDATKILLKAVLTDGLKHPEGHDIQAVLAKLSPGESQTVTLRVQAAVVGVQNCTLSAATEGAAKASTLAKLDVRQPKLALNVAGPMRCMVKAEPAFVLDVTNPGTSASDPVQLAAAFPEGLDFVSATDGGAYDAATRTVSWNLPPAAPGSKRSLSVKTKSTIAGHLAVRAVAQAGPKLSARAECVVQADGVPALMFEVADVEDPIEVGKETCYEIRLTNTGTMHCTNVKLTAAMSEGLIPGTVTSNVPHRMVGQTLVFEPIAKLLVKGEVVIRVKAKGTTPGDHRFKVQLACDQLKQPVVKEESTSFFQP